MTLTVNTTNTNPTLSSPSAVSTPRLRLEPTGSTRTLLDGGWWPRSSDPAAELPGLILAIDRVRGPVTRLILSIAAWTPRRGGRAVAGRYPGRGASPTHPPALLRAARARAGGDLRPGPRDPAPPTAEAAMALAATAGNRVHAQHLLAAVASTPATRADHELPAQVWESEDGHPHTGGSP